MYGNGITGPQTWVYRWAYEPDAWTDFLHDHGFADIHARVESAPDAYHVGTFIVKAGRRLT